MNEKVIKIEYHSDEIERLKYIDGKSDWIDLRAAERVELKAGDFKLISLGVSMRIPEGYEAHLAPRSSTSDPAISGGNVPSGIGFIFSIISAILFVLVTTTS